jgi:hypothetical protein
VSIRGCLKGSMDNGGTNGGGPPQVSISGANGLVSTVFVNLALYMQDVTITGDTLAIHILNTASVRFVNVGAAAGRDADHVNTTDCNATGCNVVLGSMNAAMLVENSFWLWFERVAFDFAPALGQRPSVILRGRNCKEGESPWDCKEGESVGSVSVHYCLLPGLPWSGRAFLTTVAVYILVTGISRQIRSRDFHGWRNSIPADSKHPRRWSCRMGA